MFSILLSLMILQGGSVAKAQSDLSGEIPDYCLERLEDVQPQVVEEQGRPMRLRWNDGREAIVEIQLIASYSIGVPLEVIENTCVEGSSASCKMFSNGATLNVRARWISHPFVSQIGQSVIQIRSRGTSYEQRGPLTAHQEFTTRTTLKERVGIDMLERLSCDSYAWLPGGSRRLPPATVKFARWSNEDSLTNAHTEAPELRVESSTLDLEFRREPEGTLLRAGGKDSRANKSRNLAAGQNITAYMEINQGDICQMTLKVDANEAAEKFSRDQRAREETTPFSPLIMGSISSLLAKRIKSQFNGLYSHQAFSDRTNRSQMVYRYCSEIE